MNCTCGPEPIHVLVVEDDAVNRDVACEMLSHLGYRTSSVDSGIAALVHVRDIGCDLVLMDYRMLGMDGLETTRRLRAGEAGPCGLTIPIVALTAQAFPADREACLMAGMNDFLSKPVVVDCLVSAVERWGRSDVDVDVVMTTLAVEPPDTAVDAPLVFDSTVLAALPMVADGTQPEYREIVLNLFLKSMPSTLASIRQAAQSGDTHAVQHLAHSLKSSSAVVGALALAACAARAEAELRAGRTQMSHLPGQFDMEYDRLCTLLNHHHQGLVHTC